MAQAPARIRLGISPAEARQREAIEAEIRDDWRWNAHSAPGRHSPGAMAILFEVFREGWLARHRRGRRSGP